MRSLRNHIRWKSIPMTAVMVPLGVLLATAFVYFLFQQPAIYRTFASPVMKNYYHEQGQIVRGPVPFSRFDPSGMLHWDAQIYAQIRDNGYDTTSAGGDFIFAFFPLFPAVWKVTGMSPLFTLFFNYALLSFSVFLILRDFSSQMQARKAALFAVSLCSPMLVVFMMPYSEGLFMATATVALLALRKSRYPVYFMAALLMSMTRPAVIMIGLALAATELFFYMRHHNATAAFRSFFLKVLPLLAGTLMVSLVQLTYGSGSLTMFLEAQQYWGSRLQLPISLTDWAHEQFGPNLTLLLFIIPASASYLLVRTFRHARNDSSGTGNADLRAGRKETGVKESRREGYNSNQQLQNETEAISDPQEYLFVFSLSYIILMALSVLFMRGGSLNGISRYILCTPFWLIALTGMHKRMLHVTMRLKGTLFSLFLAASAIALSLLPYSARWNFSDLGYVLLCAQMAFFVFDGLHGKCWYAVLHVAISALWTAYLFNMFISGAWIFT